MIQKGNYSKRDPLQTAYSLKGRGHCKNCNFLINNTFVGQQWRQTEFWFGLPDQWCLCMCKDYKVLTAFQMAMACP